MHSLSRLTVFVALAICIYGIGSKTQAQCTPPGPTSPPPAPTISATGGPDYGQISWTVGGFDPGSSTQVWMSPGHGLPFNSYSNADPTTPSGTRSNLGSGDTWFLLARSTNSCGYTESPIVTAKTFSVGPVTADAWPGPNANQISYLGHFVGPTYLRYYDSVHVIYPSGYDTNLFNFDEEPSQVLNIGGPGIYRFYGTTQAGWDSIYSPIVYVAIGEDQNWGRPRCNESRGAPVNVIDGNMYLDETDYSLPGVGENIRLTRSYNSKNQVSGLFGTGWSTGYDETLGALNDLGVRIGMPDGRAVYFGRSSTSDPFSPATPDFQGQVVKSSDGTFNLTFKDGRVHKFDVNGKLIWQKDRNGNQTTLNYDSNGLLTGITDPFSRTLTITRDGNGQIYQLSDSIGLVATYEYYPSSNYLKTVTYPDNSKFKFEYTLVGGVYYLSTVKDALDNVLETHQYDSGGRATTSESAGGNDKYTFDYSDPAMTVVTDRLGRLTKFYFNHTSGRNVVKKVEGLCGCGGGSSNEATQFLYDSRLNLVKKTDALGRETVYTYDSSQNVTSITDVLGTQIFTFNSLGEILTATDRMGGVTTNTYSSTGNLLTSKDALNNTTTLTYTSIGQPATVTDALNHVTTLTWDSQGRMTKVKDANNKETTFGFDSRARVTSVTNAKNETTTVGYDLNNRVNKITYPDTNFTQFGYDLAGRKATVTDPLGHITTYGYDGAYRLTSITDALSHTTTFGYDLMSNLTSQTDALGNVTDLEYDDFNRLKKVKYPLPVTGGTRLEEGYTYDLVGNRKTRVDTAGRTTSYDYDTANRLKTITDPLTHQTQFEYNARSQMTNVTDALSQQYVFSYDPLGRELSETRAGTTMTYDYDAVGNRKKRTDYMSRVTNYDYDVLNRLKKITYGPTGSISALPIPTVTYEYDDLSRLVSATNNAGTVAFTYDNRNRLKSEIDVFWHVIEYAYDAADRRTQLKLDGSVQTTYNYDNANRLTTLTDEASQNFTFGYDNANRLISKVMPNGITSTFDYDGMSRLTRLKHQSTTATLTDNQDSYNSANQISQIAELSQTKVFGYDNADRLTSMTNGTSNESYTFDAVGNRTASHQSSTYSYSPFNRLTAADSITQGFDANGNTVQKSEGSNFWHYFWDEENRLTSVSTRKQTVRYVYDALGRRVRRHFAGSKENTKYTYDGLDVVLDDDLGVTTKYQNGLGIDNKLELATGSTSKYFLQDHLGSTIGLTNSSGSITESNSYDSFGTPSNPLFSSRYGFTGREYDSFSRLQFSRARWYDPKTGRFVSEDPIGLNGGDVNLYGYVRNQPQIYRDQRGLFPDGEVLADPNFLRNFGAAIVATGGAIASSPVAVGVGGAAIGVGIGLPVGIYTANHPANPFVNGPLNPFRIWDKLWEPTPYPIVPPLRIPTTSTGPACRPAPRAIPWTRSPSIPWSDDPDDGDKRDCDRQLAIDEATCSQIIDRGKQAACYKHAFDRWASCRAGRNIPYNPWPQFPWD